MPKTSRDIRYPGSEETELEIIMNGGDDRTQDQDEDRVFLWVVGIGGALALLGLAALINHLWNTFQGA